MRLTSLLAGLAFFALSAHGQADSLKTRSGRISYTNYFGSGVLLGKDGRGTTASFSTVHGIRVKGFVLGLGTGYDDYNRADLSDQMGYDYYMRWKVVPVFLSLSADWAKIRENALFLQVNGGYSFIRPIKRDNANVVENSEGGLMLNPSLGYRIYSGKHRIYIGAGYKVQRNKYGYNPSPWIWGPPSPQINVKETMQRMEVRIGFGWN